MMFQRFKERQALEEGQAVQVSHSMDTEFHEEFLKRDLSHLKDKTYERQSIRYDALSYQDAPQQPAIPKVAIKLNLKPVLKPSDKDTAKGAGKSEVKAISPLKLGIPFKIKKPSISI